MIWNRLYQILHKKMNGHMKYDLIINAPYCDDTAGQLHSFIF